ncbi:MAG: hypothetical protein JWM06_2246 [Actinomycetia bacterium]|nr:hypothetical protein [Actinomycetes bacterium]
MLGLTLSDRGPVRRRAGQTSLVDELVGYWDRLSARPGETVELKLSSTTGAPASVELVRLVHGHRGPAGPGFVQQPVAPLATDLALAPHPLRLGSCAVASGTWSAPEALSLTTIVQATRPVGRQGLLAAFDADAGHGWQMLLDDGVPVFEHRSVDGVLVLRATAALSRACWHVLAVRLAADGACTLLAAPVVGGVPTLWESRVDGRRAPGPIGAGPTLTIAAAGWSAREAAGVEHFDGKLEAPKVLAAAPGDAELLALALAAHAPVEHGVAVLGSWDLGVRVGAHTDWVTDRGPCTRAAQLVNAPTRAVTGWRFTGEETDPRLRPDHYGAIHFHSDDLSDARWPTAVTVRLDPELPSGVYAARVRAGEHEDHVPLFVTPRPGRPRARVALLMPTFRYLAYANINPNLSGDLPEPLERPVDAAGAYAARHGLRSLYDCHADGSGVAFSSERRPIANLRPDYTLAGYDCPDGLAADLCIVHWLTDRGTPFDVLTDHVLHAEGADALDPYRVVVTGSHPEYWSQEMLDALETFLDTGGRALYLGGNGLYWVTGRVDGPVPGIEVRRGHTGTRGWTSAPGECHMASNGAPGGLWRLRGRPPQRAVGVGFTAVGMGRARPYVRTERSRGADVAYLFEGIGEEPIGAAGLILGGAAGHEIDRADLELAPDRETHVLASATGFCDLYQRAVEEVMRSNSRQGGTIDPLVRADLTLQRRAGGGAVLATGSISWAGALSVAASTVGRLTGNALDRFASDDAV